MDADVSPAHLAPDGERSGDLPILATDPEPFANIGNGHGTPADVPILAHDIASIGTGDDLPILATEPEPFANIGNVPEEAFTPVAPAAPKANTGNPQANLRIERSGSLKAPDGKGQYWIWRWMEVHADGTRKRRSRYGGKVEAAETGYWGAPLANIGKYAAERG